MPPPIDLRRRLLLWSFIAWIARADSPEALDRMEGGGYYMGMMSDSLDNNGLEWDGTGSPPEEQRDATANTTPTTQGTKKPRNKNFSEVEDVVHVKAWLGTSTNPVAGTNQKHGAFWTRVHNCYHAEKEITVLHSSNSLSHRWTTIQECVNRFCSSFAAIEGRNQSGKTFENKIMDACKIYKEEDKENKPFQLLYCWTILRHEPKWLERMTQLASNKSSQKKHMQADSSIMDLTGCPNDDVPSADCDAPKRPMVERKLNNCYGKVEVMHALKHLTICGKKRRLM